MGHRAGKINDQPGKCGFSVRHLSVNSLNARLCDIQV